jgi:chaperonin GroES
MKEGKKNMSAIAVKQIRPLPGFLVIEPLEGQKQTESGIYLPESGEEKPQVGKVVAISKSYVNEHGTQVECPVAVGDVVLYKKWGGNEVKVENRKEVQVMKFEDVLAIIK